MLLDKLTERTTGNLKAIEDARSNLLSMIGHIESEDHSIASKMAIQRILNFLRMPILVNEECDTLKQAEYFLISNGVPCLSYTLSGKWWKSASGPLLCEDKNGKLTAILPSAFGYYYYDASGDKRRVNKKNSLNFKPNALCASKPLPSKKLSMKEFYRFMLESVPAVNWIAIFVFCTIATLLNMLLPVANKILFNEVIPSGSFDEILPICALLIGAGFSSVLFGICNSQVLLRTKDKVNSTVQPALISRLLFLPSNFFKYYSSGDLSMRVLSVNTSYQLLTNQILTIFAGGIFSIMYILIAFLYAKSMIWVITLTSIITFVVSYFEIKASIKEYNRKLPNSVRTQNFSKSAISGIQKIKNNRAEARVFAQWAKRFSQSEVKSADSSFFMRYKKGFGAAVITIGPLLAYYSAWYSNIALSDYVAFMSAFGIMITAIDSGRRSLDAIAKISPQMKLLEPILENEPEIKDNVSEVNMITGSIDLNHITFIYNPKSPKVLDDVSIHIPAGQSVGIVGSSGCGKSTLMRIMMGFEKPTSGTVYFGQYNVNDINIIKLRQYVGYCPQNLQIFPGTIEDNIRMGNGTYSDEEIWAAARAACIDEDLMAMPDKLQTLLGEGGSGLSGGQCQRLLIARALINRPKVLFLDEATSALDNITQKGVAENIDRMGCTRIIIAHRLSTVMNCHRIIVLDKGKVVEDGSPEELMNMKGFFYQLCLRQM